MTTQTAPVPDTPALSLNNLLLKDTEGMSTEQLQQHFDAINDASSKASTAATEQLKTVNETLSKESTDIKSLTDEISNTAVNDDVYAQAIDAFANGVKIIESVIPLSF